MPGRGGPPQCMQPPVCALAPHPTDSRLPLAMSCSASAYKLYAATENGPAMSAALRRGASQAPATALRAPHARAHAREEVSPLRERRLQLVPQLCEFRKQLPCARGAAQVPVVVRLRLLDALRLVHQLLQPRHLLLELLHQLRLRARALRVKEARIRPSRRGGGRARAAGYLSAWRLPFSITGWNPSSYRFSSRCRSCKWRTGSGDTPPRGGVRPGHQPPPLLLPSGRGVRAYPLHLGLGLALPRFELLPGLGPLLLEPLVPGPASAGQRRDRG